MSVVPPTRLLVCYSSQHQWSLPSSYWSVTIYNISSPSHQAVGLLQFTTSVVPSTRLLQFTTSAVPPTPTRLLICYSSQRQRSLQLPPGYWSVTVHNVSGPSNSHQAIGLLQFPASAVPPTRLLICYSSQRQRSLQLPPGCLSVTVPSVSGPSHQAIGLLQFTTSVVPPTSLLVCYSSQRQ